MMLRTSDHLAVCVRACVRFGASLLSRDTSCIGFGQGARRMFTSLYERMSDVSDLSCQVIEVSEEAKMVFVVWKCPASGIEEATSTLIFDSNHKVIRKNMTIRTTV